MWIPPETKDPILLHHPTRKNVGYFGAVRLRDGKYVFKREHGNKLSPACKTAGLIFRFVIADGLLESHPWKQL
jgi:hypothetical protein